MIYLRSYNHLFDLNQDTVVAKRENLRYHHVITVVKIIYNLNISKLRITEYKICSNGIVCNF